MKDILLYIVFIYVIVVLVMIAILYIWRPKWVLIDDDPSLSHEVNMWRAFNVSLLAGILVICLIAAFLFMRARQGYPLTTYETVDE